MTKDFIGEPEGINVAIEFRWLHGRLLASAARTCPAPAETDNNKTSFCMIDRVVISVNFSQGGAETPLEFLS